MSVGVGATWCLPQQRRRLIADYVNIHGWATVKELSEIFEVSVATTRRDLEELACSRMVVRVHGGAGRSD